ncbi:MAG: hypothetical protein RL745_111 [Actinomycetota bacterium]
MATANLETEQSLVQPGQLLGGVDEVGRGALAGPVVVGIVVVDPHSCGQVPPGLTDSKLLSPKRRRELVPLIHDWALYVGIGEASAADIDEVGIMTALALAAQRAMLDIDSRCHAFLLDGSTNWLDRSIAFRAARTSTKVKADVTCAAVAAASVVAKVHRDALMVSVASDYPEYGWQGNKGYASADHRAAIEAHGPTEMHRLSWRLLPEDPEPTLFD